MIFSLPVEVGYQTFVVSLQKIVKVSLMEAIKANKVTCIKSLARRKKNNSNNNNNDNDACRDRWGYWFILAHRGIKG